MIYILLFYRIAGENYLPCNCENHTKFAEACDYIIAKVDGVSETLNNKDKSENHKKHLRVSVEKGNMKITHIEMFINNHLFIIFSSLSFHIVFLSYYFHLY